MITSNRNTMQLAYCFTNDTASYDADVYRQVNRELTKYEAE